MLGLFSTNNLLLVVFVCVGAFILGQLAKKKKSEPTTSNVTPTRRRDTASRVIAVAQGMRENGLDLFGDLLAALANGEVAEIEVALRTIETRVKDRSGYAEIVAQAVASIHQRQATESASVQQALSRVVAAGDVKKT